MSASIRPLSFEEHRLLNELISSRFGISFPEEKRDSLEAKLRPRLKALRLHRFLDYYLLLQYDFSSEADALTQLVTNNETYFFRETYQFEALFEGGLELIGRPTVGAQLQVLCAGCSSGEEPYSLSIFSREHLPGNGLRIDAFDLDGARLERASSAVYGTHSLRAASEEQIRNYFMRSGSDQYELVPRYRDKVRFSRGNILDIETWPAKRGYDIIFCRNVLIYFSEEALHRAIDHFAQALRPGGLLFLGHAESIIGVSPHFDAVRLKRCIAYRRVRPAAVSLSEVTAAGLSG